MSFKYQADELAVQSPALGQHFVTHTEQSLHWSVCALATMDHTVVHMNGCKSVNHIMKIGIEWKPRRLVNYLHTVADVDIDRTLHSQDSYILTEAVWKLVVRHATWQTMSPPEKNAHMAVFLAYQPTCKTIKSFTSIITYLASLLSYIR